MTVLDIRRHQELFDPHYFTEQVVVVGAGASGSWLVLQLAKLGITDITVYDFDIVEEHNIPNQLFGLHHVGMPKVKALQQIVKDYTGTEIIAINEKFDTQRVSGYVYLMVDSMSARKDIWEASVRLKPSVKLLVEPRMGLNEGRVYNVNPMDINHIKAYEACWYPDEEAEVSACGSSQSVITSALHVASICARQLINSVREEELSNEILVDMVFNQVYETRW